MPALRTDLVCREAVELMTDYLEGALSWRQRRRLERHLRACPSCRAYLEQLRLTVAAMGEIEPDALDPATRQDLIDLLRRYRGTGGEE
ncbi:MAG: zf-HC2 domain-containing protein [Acidimicrobiales bacterium]